MTRGLTIGKNKITSASPKTDWPMLLLLYKFKEGKVYRKKDYFLITSDWYRDSICSWL